MRTINVFVTNKNTEERITLNNNLMESTNEVATLVIDPTKKYQEMIGFGGAMTEAAAYTLSRVSEDKRAEVIKAYYDKEEGLAYNIARMHIHSCDFALGNYTYVEDHDVELKTFNIEREHKWVLPLYHDAVKVSNESIKVLASPWSPPAWMKDTNEMNNGGKLLEEYKPAWANYYAKYIDEVRKAGVNLWGITVQNEPAATQVWDSCIYTGEDEMEFVRDHLGPTLEKTGLLEDTKIIIWDHNRDILVERASAVLSNTQASKYVWGTGIHWYVSEEFENLSKVHDLFPDKHLLFTEGCQEGGVHLGSWLTGERYARNMIGDINNWCEGYLDWNIVLDETGGPNHVNNLCDAPIIVDTLNNEIIYNSSYYYIGHFSKFVREGAKRIHFETTNQNIGINAFLNPDQSQVVVLLNETEHEEAIVLKEEENFKVVIPARSIVTVELK